MVLQIILLVENILNNKMFCARTPTYTLTKKKNTHILMKKLLIYTFLIIGLVSCGNNERLAQGEIKINWTNNLSGDFSFKENWDYPDGVYKNEFGQLSCDGLCPPETDKMKDEEGRIFEDSLAVFYQLVDTTHRFHSIQSDAWCYEWDGTDFVTATRLNNDTILCFTHNNVATHSSLHLTITKNKCIPIIELNSINHSTEIINYTCKSGKIEIDKNFWAKGILKAKFDLIFDHKENPPKEMYWRGNIYADIGNNMNISKHID